jgi:peptide/nickel transport system substrate-binding protein
VWQSQPALATSWTRQDAITGVFHLRQAKFQDSTDFTAASVVDALGHATAANPSLGRSAT